jgi:hypothetical protein
MVIEHGDYKWSLGRQLSVRMTIFDNYPPGRNDGSLGTMNGFLLGRVCRVPFLVVVRLCSGKCREKNERERQQSWGKRNCWRSRWMFFLQMAFEATEAN